MENKKEREGQERNQHASSMECRSSEGRTLAATDRVELAEEIDEEKKGEDFEEEDEEKRGGEGDGDLE